MSQLVILWTAGGQRKMAFPDHSPSMTCHAHANASGVVKSGQQWDANWVTISTLLEEIDEVPGGMEVPLEWPGFDHEPWTVCRRSTDLLRNSVCVLAALVGHPQGAKVKSYVSVIQATWRRHNRSRCAASCCIQREWRCLLARRRQRKTGQAISLIQAHVRGRCVRSRAERLSVMLGAHHSALMHLSRFDLLERIALLSLELRRLERPSGAASPLPPTAAPAVAHMARDLSSANLVAGVRCANGDESPRSASVARLFQEIGRSCSYTD